MLGAWARQLSFRLSRPALSEDAQFFTPTAVPGLSSRNTPSLDTGQRPEMHEYFNHAMEIVRLSYSLNLDRDADMGAMQAPNEADWMMQQQQQQQEYDYASQQHAQNGHDPAGYYGAQQQAFTRHPVREPRSVRARARRRLTCASSSNTTSTTPQQPRQPRPHRPSSLPPRCIKRSRPRARRRTSRRPST